MEFNNVELENQLWENVVSILIRLRNVLFHWMICLKLMKFSALELLLFSSLLIVLLITIKGVTLPFFFFYSYSLHFIKIDGKYFVSNLCIYVTVKLFKCRIEYKPKAEAVYLKLHSILTGIQTGRIEDEKGWTVLVD